MRNQSGNMLIMVGVFSAMSGVLILLASSFGALFVEESRLQQSANEIALSGARKLNENDRIGQMNNMVARCRQLVFCSSDTYSQVDTSYEHLRHLSEQLADEARESAELLETERHQLSVLAKNEANDAMLAKFNEIKTTYPMCLPWLRVDTPVLHNRKNGKIADVQSNVLEMKGFHDLEAHDAAQGYLHTYPDMKLYKQDCDAHLPGGDNYLHFKLASLPAPVADSSAPSIISNTTTVSPARAVLAQTFRTMDGDELPSACQCTLKMTVATTLGASSSQTAQAIGTAVATGGGLPL